MVQQQQVIEVVEYIDDSDWEGDEDDYEEVVEIVQEVVNVPKKNFSAVAAYEVGIGAPPPLFLTPKEKAKLAREKETATSTSTSTPTSTNGHAAATTSAEQKPQQPVEYIPAKTWQGSKPGYYFGTTQERGTGYHLDPYQQQQQAVAAPAVVSPQPTPSESSPAPPRSPRKASTRLSTRRHLSIINQALDLPEDHQLSDYEEEIVEEEIIEEEYYEEEYEEEYIEDEIIEEYYDDEEYVIEEVVDESEQERKAREQLEAEIADIERQIAEAKKKKEQRMTEGSEVVETSKEKAQRMAAKSRLQACKQQKVESDFKRKAAARAKILAERENNWGKKGKKKQKDLADIIAGKAKKQKKLLSRQKSKDGTKKNPQPPNQHSAQSSETPAAERPAEPQEEKKQLSMAEMLAQKAQKGSQGMQMGKAKASTEVKLAAPDDFGDDDLRAEDFLPSDDEEEEEEEPKLTPEEEHAKRLQWQKPSWTQAKLKTTTKGNKIKAGKTLSAPITFIPKKINEGLEEDEEDDAPSKGALMKGAMRMVQLPKVKKHQAGLNFTGNGARIRDGGKIEKQINPKVKNKEEVKIWGADPEELKLTPRGLTARKGKILSDEITQATQNKKYQFEKPAWAKTQKSHLLKATETGEHLKEGEDIAPTITKATEEKKYQFEKPTWTTKKLKSTESGEKVKSGAYLSAPIVNLEKKTMNVNLEANPAFLRMTDQGEKLMEEGNLEGPITAAPALAKRC